MTIHTLPPGAISPERIAEIAHLSQSDPDVRGYRSFHSPAQGRIVWLLEAPHREAVAAWSARVGLPLDALSALELEGHRGVIRRVQTILSNRLRGVVTEVHQDATAALVCVTAGADILVHAFLTPESLNAMRLRVDDAALTIFKAISISLEKSAEGTPPMQLSFPNQIKGTVTRIIEGPTLFIVHLDTPAGEIVSAIIPSAAERIGLKVGDEVTALFKALDVSLAKAADEA